MFEPKIKIERNLYATLKQAAQVAGYSSVDEFITHILEKTAAEVQQAVGGNGQLRRPCHLVHCPRLLTSALQTTP